MSFFKILVIGFVLTCSVISSTTQVYSQEADSLLEQLQFAKTEEEFIRIYNSLGNKLRYAYPDSALEFYRLAFDLASKNKNELDIADAYNAIGSIWAIKHNYDSAMYYSTKGMKIHERLKNEPGIAKSLNSLGLIELQKDNLEPAKKYLLSAVEKGVELNDSTLLSKAYNNLGLLFKRKNNYDSALYYYHESLKIKEQLNDLSGIGSTTSNIGLIYEDISEFDLALKYFNQSIIIRRQNKDRYGEAIVLNNFGLVYESQGDFNKALRFYKKSLSVMVELGKQARIATLYNNLGSVSVKLKDYKNAFEYLTRGLEINRKLGNKRGQIHTLLDLAKFYENLNVYQNAVIQYNQALELSLTIEDFALKSEIYEGLYNSYQMLNRYDSALYFYKKYTLLNDTIFNTYSKRNVERLEINYQTLKNEKENQDLIRQNQVKEEKLKRLFLGAGILLVILASIIVFTLLSFKSRQKLEKTYQLVLEQRNDIQTQSHELENAYRKLQEFSNFKEELTSMIVHDLKNPLNIILNVSRIKNYPDRDQVILQSGKQMLNLVMNILDVYKYEGKTLGLEKSEQFINPLIDKVRTDMGFLLSEKSIRIKTHIDYDFKVKLDAEAIERVVVNFFTNAIKFSPTGSTIQINTEPLKDNRFRFHVIDQGEGISGDNISQIFNKFEQREKRKLGYSGSTGIGLTYCKMAIEEHGGIIGVESELGKGADFYFELEYVETKISELIDSDGKGTYLLLSRENRRILYPHIMSLQEKDIYEVTEIRRILKMIDKENKELITFCNLIENSVLNCNQVMFDELLELALSKD